MKHHECRLIAIHDNPRRRRAAPSANAMQVAAVNLFHCVCVECEGWTADMLGGAFDEDKTMRAMPNDQFGE